MSLKPLGFRVSFVCLVGNNRRTKRQTKKKELTPMKTVIKTSIGGPFLRPYFILTAIALGLLALSPGCKQSFRRRMAAIPGPIRQRGKTLF